MLREERMIENFTVLHSLYLGDREIVLGMDKEEAMPYAKPNGIRHGFLALWS